MKIDGKTRNLIIKESKEAKNFSYSPYSNFRVGAALLTSGNRIVTGANVENASYGLSMCAERVALFKAVSSGESRFKALAVSSDKKGVIPCGACLQALLEFSEGLAVFYQDKAGKYKALSLKELLPKGFVFTKK